MWDMNKLSPFARYTLDIVYLVIFSALFGYYIFYLSEAIDEIYDQAIRIVCLFAGFLLYGKTCKSYSRWRNSANTSE